MQFTIYNTEESKLERVLKSIDEEYITLLINPHQVYFILDGLECYMHYGFNIVNGFEVDDLRVIRINRKKFLEVLTIGKLVFTIADDIVKIEFYDDVRYAYTLRCNYQEALFEKYVKSLQLFVTADKYPMVDLSSLVSMIRIAKTLAAPITSNEGVAQVNCKSNVFIYKEFDGPAFTVDGKNISMLMSYTPQVYNVQNYLVYTSEGLCIAVRKLVLQEGFSYDYILNQPSAYKVVFKMEQMINLSKRLRLTDGDLVLNLDKDIISYREKLATTSTRIDVLEKVSAKDKKNSSDGGGLKINLSQVSVGKVSKYPSIVIPHIVVKTILKNLRGMETITLYVRRTFILLEYDNIKIVFSREEV